MRIFSSVLLIILTFSARGFSFQEWPSEDYNIQNNNELRPFTTEGCTYIPDAFPFVDLEPLGPCCLKHDIQYWLGGTYEEKLDADQELGQCAERIGYPKLFGFALYFGPHQVGPWIPAKYWRWGFGWKYNRGYRPVTPEQREQARRLLQDFTQKLNKALDPIGTN